VKKSIFRRIPVRCEDEETSERKVTGGDIEAGADDWDEDDEED